MDDREHGLKPINILLEQIKDGKFVIPHFQRKFSWLPNMVKDLIVSIIHGYYAGTLLFWNLSDEQKKLAEWDSLWGAEKSEKPTTAILDGQQRLSSIYYAFCAPKKRFPERKSFYYFFLRLNDYLDGDEDESVFYKTYSTYKDSKFFKNDIELCKKGYFPLCLLNEPEYLDSPGFEKWVSSYMSYNKVNEEKNLTNLTVARKIGACLNYKFLTETLEEKSTSEVCTIFERINSKGMKLNIFDLMNAFLYPHGIVLKKEWEKIDNIHLKAVDSQMKVYLLKLISLHMQNYCSTKYLYNLVPESKIKDRQGQKRVLVENSKQFKKLWNDAVKSAEKSRKKIMNSGSDDFGAIKPQFIPNTTMLPVLGALLLKYESMKDNVPEVGFWKKIKKWYWCAILSGDYSGSSDTVMSKDYRELIKWLEDEKSIPERIKKVNSIFLQNSVNLYGVKNTNYSQYSAVLNLLALRSALDFYNGRQVGKFDPKDIHDHHIFPTKSGIKMDNELKDCILNRTLLTADTNNEIKKKKPSEYIKIILEKNNDDWSVLEKIMESHLISKEALKHLQRDEFKEFLRERNKTIKEEFKKLIGIAIDPEITSYIYPENPFDNEQAYLSPIESAEDFLQIMDPYFNRTALKLLNKGIKNNDSINSVQILTKLHPIDEEFKDDYKKFKKQQENKQINIELRVLLDRKSSNDIHDRYLLTKNKEYNYVSADTASRGQISHILEVTGMSPKFRSLWEKGKEIFGNWNQIIEKKKELEGIETPDQVPEYIQRIYPEYEEYAHSAAILTVLYEHHHGEENAIDSFSLAEKMIKRFPKLFEGKTPGQVSNGNIFAGSNLLNRKLLKIGYRKYPNSDDEYRVYWM